jgi:hypothetical protein
VSKDSTKPSNINSVKIGKILGYPKPIDILDDNIIKMNKYSISYLFNFSDLDKYHFYKYNRESNSVIKITIINYLHI